MSFYDTLSYRDYKIIVYPGGDYAIPQNYDGVEYFYESDPEPNVLLGSSVNFSVVFPMNSDVNKAFQISQAVITAARYYEAMEGTSLPKVDIVYPYLYGDNNYFYLPDCVNIKDQSNIYQNCPNSYASWDAIMHEYGHHVTRYLGIEDNPGGIHSITLNHADLIQDKDKGIRLAWGEAYPTVFALLAQNYYSSSLNSIFTVGDTSYTASNYSERNLESITNVYGDGCEGAIIGVLWDLFDNSSTETHDTISTGHSSFWSLVSDSGAVTMFDFVFHYMSTQSVSSQRKLSTLLSYYRIAAYDLDYEITASTASFFWEPGGTSPRYYLNDSFDLVFCNANNIEVLRIEYLSDCEYTLTASEFATLKNACGNTLGFYVVAFQTDEPATGLYESEYITVSIPN